MTTDENLRSSALQALDACGTAWPLGKVWADLVEGRSKAADWFCAEKQCVLILRARLEPEPAEFRHAWRNLEILRRVLRGDAQKAIAIEFNISPSTVTTAATQCASAMGFDCSARRIPIVLMMAAHEDARRGARTLARTTTFEWESATYRVLATGRPTASLLQSLSQAERDIVELLVERRSNSEIGRIRSTSTRTVANQLSSVLRKLEVPGRIGVLSKLVEAYASFSVGA
jgi:DNA-binding CsgD family transcriptional regulator